MTTGKLQTLDDDFNHTKLKDNTEPIGLEGETRVANVVDGLSCSSSAINNNEVRNNLEDKLSTMSIVLCGNINNSDKFESVTSLNNDNNSYDCKIMNESFKNVEIVKVFLLKLVNSTRIPHVTFFFFSCKLVTS